MKNKILEKATELFLIYGFKSVTMDDIANALGISKKTIYQHFKNKTKLVEATTLGLFNFISNGINCICAMDKNPIEEIYEVKSFAMTHLKDEKSSPIFQLQKYYPKIYATLKTKQYEVMQTCVVRNLKRGIKKEIYRDAIDIDIIAKIYMSTLLITLKDQELFPFPKYTVPVLMDNYIEYHLRGICTAKGMQYLEKIINKN
jgi:predicted transcriptional regulator